MLFNIGFIALYGCRAARIILTISVISADFWSGAIYGFFQIPGDVYKDPRKVGKTTELLGLICTRNFYRRFTFQHFSHSENYLKLILEVVRKIENRKKLDADER